jgi:hypothetical protein
MISYIKRHIPGWEGAIVVSPDAGGAKRCVCHFHIGVFAADHDSVSLR